MDNWRNLPTGAVVTLPAGDIPREGILLSDGRHALSLTDEEMQPETDETGIHIVNEVGAEVCTYCGGQGHWRPDCPVIAREVRASRSRSPVTGL
jgi:hypothetical protein